MTDEAGQGDIVSSGEIASNKKSHPLFKGEKSGGQKELSVGMEKDRKVRKILSESPPPAVREKIINGESLEFVEYQAGGIFFKDDKLLNLSEEARIGFMDQMIQAFSNEAEDCYIRPRGRDPSELQNQGSHFVVKHFGPKDAFISAAVSFVLASQPILDKFGLEGKVSDYLQLSIGTTPTQPIVYDIVGSKIIERPNNEADLIEGAITAKGLFCGRESNDLSKMLENEEVFPIVVLGGDVEGVGLDVVFESKTDRPLHGVLLTYTKNSDYNLATSSPRHGEFPSFSDDELSRLDVSFDGPYATSQLLEVLSDEEKEKLLKDKCVTVNLGSRKIVTYDIAGSTRIAQFVSETPNLVCGMNSFYEELQAKIVDSWEKSGLMVAQSAGDGQLGMGRNEIDIDAISDSELLDFTQQLLVISREFNALLHDNTSENNIIAEFISHLRSSDVPLPRIKVSGGLSDVELKLLPSTQTLETYIKKDGDPVDLEQYLKAVKMFNAMLSGKTDERYHNLAHVDSTLYQKLLSISEDDLRGRGILLLAVEGEHFVLDITETGKHEGNWS